MVLLTNNFKVKKSTPWQKLFIQEVKFPTVNQGESAFQLLLLQSVASIFSKKLISPPYFLMKNPGQ